MLRKILNAIIITIISAIIVLLFSIEGFASTINTDNYIQIYTTDELTDEMLMHRNGAWIVEKIVGVVINENGDGKILSTTLYDYISYSELTYEVHTGDIILTLLFYNPDTNYTDDVIIRSDYIIG